MSDLSVEKFAAILEYLDPAPEASKALDKWGTKAKSQKAHMVGWMFSQVTTGAKGFTRYKGNTSSAEAYNRLLNPGAMLWIADALGEDFAILQQAAQAAIEAEKVNYRGRCLALRKVIPWRRIYELVTEPRGWRIDPAVKPLLSWRGGWPAVKPSKQEQYDKVIESELG